MKRGNFKQYVEELQRYDAALSDTHFGWEPIGEGAIYSHSTEGLVVKIKAYRRLMYLSGKPKKKKKKKRHAVP